MTRSEKTAGKRRAPQATSGPLTPYKKPPLGKGKGPAQPKNVARPKKTKATVKRNSG